MTNDTQALLERLREGRRRIEAIAIEALSSALAAAERERDDLQGPVVHALASLAAAISLLERGGKKAAPSDKMFEQMLTDYRNALERARAALPAKQEQDL